MSIDDMIAVLKAAKEGKPIQRRTGNSWVDAIGVPTFACYRYRVKPEPREWYIQESLLGEYNLRRWEGATDPTIRVREVLE